MIITCIHCGKEMDLRITNVLEQRISRMIETFETELRDLELTNDSKMQHYFAVGLLKTLLSDKTEIIEAKGKLHGNS